jgi:hypothetical protein
VIEMKSTDNFLVDPKDPIYILTFDRTPSGKHLLRGSDYSLSVEKNAQFWAETNPNDIVFFLEDPEA